MEPLISVIIPYYKADPYIERCVESIFSQTVKDVEIVIAVDEKDISGKKFLESKNWPSVKVITGGEEVSANRNAAINEAKGKYFFFIDADDFLLRDDTFEIMLKGISDNNADMAIGEMDLYYEERDEIVRAFRLPEDILDVIDVREALKIRYDSRSMFVGSCNILYKRELIGDARFDEALVAAEDGVFTLEILKKRPRIYAAKGLVSYAYRKGQYFSSISKAPMKRMYGLMEMREKDKELVEKEFPEFKDFVYLDYFSTLRRFLIDSCTKASKKDGSLKDGKKLHKWLRKKYMNSKKEVKQYLGTDNVVWRLLLRLNLLWRTYRILATISPNKERN